MHRLTHRTSYGRTADICTLILFSVVAGVFSGTAVTLYNVCTGYGEKYSVAWYGAFIARPYLIPLLFVALCAAAILIGTILRFIPIAKGSGVPQAEGATRGVFRLKWFRTMCTAFALSLSTVFLGMNAGSEGPSIMIGACAGSGVGRLTDNTRNERCIIGGAASAGLAVAFNAPLTGFLFAVEEAHRKFTPEIIISALFSVISGVAVRNGILTLLSFADPSFTVSSAFSAFDLSGAGTFTDTMTVAGLSLIAALAVGFLGVGFYYAVMGMRKVFARIVFLGGAGRMLVPFVAAGAFGLISFYEMGGGHSLIEALGTHGGTQDFSVTLNFASPVVVALATVLILKFASSVFNMGAGVPCGVFIPMLATGACAAGVFSYIAQSLGMNAAYSDIIVMTGTAAFFSAVVKAPLTATVMVFELTGSYNFNLLFPVVIASAVGYTVGKLMRTGAVYDVLLEGYAEQFGEKGKRMDFTLNVKAGGFAVGRSIRDLLLPYGAAVSDVRRNDERFVPNDDLNLKAGDEITISAAATRADEKYKELYALVNGTALASDDDLPHIPN